MRDPENVRVLIGCETSGVVREAFLARGFDAWSCDIEEADTATNRHIVDDLRNVLEWEKWDFLAVMHPPCTALTNCSNRWFYETCKTSTPEERLKMLEEGAAFFSDCLHAKVPFRAVENPVMGPKAKAAIRDYRKWTQTVQPWQFGNEEEGPDNVSKRTCLWLTGVPKLVRTGTLDGSTARPEIHEMRPGPNRGKDRSKSFPGIARAMAAQWGDHLCEVLI